MKATIFSLPTQEKLFRAIRGLLRDCLYRNLDIEHIVYDDKDRPAAKQSGGAYLELLRASTIGVNDFVIEAQDDSGNWGYYWDDWNVIGKSFLRLNHSSRESVFPGVAIMDRMVMLPAGIHQAIDTPSTFSFLLRPVDLQGVLLVDFSDEEAIRRAIQEAASRFKSEIVSLARRHMHVEADQSPDLESLSDLIGVEEEFIQGLREEIVKPLGRLTVVATSPPARLLKKSHVTLEIRNEFEGGPEWARVQVRGPRMTKAVIRYVDFPPNKPRQRTVEFDIIPGAAPYCPLEILISGTNDDPRPPIPLIIDVIP